MFGFLNINKPAGVTSRDVVNKVQYLLPRDVKVGHAGTLDPMATGVLVLCVGQATRLVPHVHELKKSYRAGFRLGCRSDTDDSTGNVLETGGAPVISPNDIAAALSQFRGKTMQTPPQYSALRVNGKRAYDLARAGRTVDLAPREVEVSRIELLRCDGNDLEVEIDCSSGTYIRSIARDLGEGLGVGGLMTSLVRTAVGPFRVESAINANTLSSDNVAAALLPSALAVVDWPSITASEIEAAELRQGKTIPCPPELQHAESICALDVDKRLVAIGEIKPGDRFQPRMVFPEA